MTADRARERLDRGLQALMRVDDDPAVLSYALSALHGALDAHFRSVLASDQDVPIEVRAVVLDECEFGFRQVASAMQEHLRLPTSERDYLLEVLGHRDAQDRGDGFAWDRTGLEGYARYVAQKLGETVPEALRHREAGQSASTAPTSPPVVTVGEAVCGVPSSSDRWAGLAATRPYRFTVALAHGADLRATHLLLILGALAVVTLLWNWVESAAFEAGSRATVTPVAAPRPPDPATQPVAASSPSIEQVRQAASPVVASTPPAASGQTVVAKQGELLVVGNTDGEGVYLRRTPSMDDRLEAYEDGAPMRVIGPDREAEGRRWKQVRADDGLVGWVPAEYLISLRAR